MALQLSVNRINQTSPYQVVSYEEGAVVFITDHGIKYEVCFIVDYTLEIDDSYQMCIRNIDNLQQPRDIKVRDTIIAIIEEFFVNNQLSMLYICDTSDGRQSSRHRIFSMWFSQSVQNKNYTCIPAHICVDEIDYYASLILRNDHPEYDKITGVFRDFEDNLKDKWDL